MSRIPPAPAALYEPLFGTAASPTMQVYAHAPETAGAAGETLEEGLVCSLEKPSEAPDLTEAERVALAFADRMATDHLSVSDATFEELRRHFSDGELRARSWTRPRS